jgi:antirestriction protein
MDFAEQYLDDSGILNEVPENLRYYFDVERFSRDLFIGDYF